MICNIVLKAKADDCEVFDRKVFGVQTTNDGNTNSIVKNFGYCVQSLCEIGQTKVLPVHEITV